MGAQLTAPAPRLPLPRFIQQGRAETVTLPLYAAGARVSSAAATYSLLDSDGAVVVDAAAATPVAGVASYDLGATFADDHELPLDPWRERWVIDGVTYEHEVHVCRVAPVRHVTVEDLYRLQSAWRTLLPRLMAAGTVDDPLDVAWEDLLTRLLGDGHLPNRTLNWWRLSRPHKLLAAAHVCRQLMVDAEGASRWERLGAAYEADAWKDYEQHLGLQVDSDEDGVADTPGQLDGASPQTFLTNVPGGPSWR